VRARSKKLLRSALAFLGALGALLLAETPESAAQEAPRPPDAAPAQKKVDPGSAAILASAGVEIGGRSISYTDLVIENLRTYNVFGAPLAKIAVEVYPAAFVPSKKFLSNLGVSLLYAGAFGLDSSLPNGEAVGTSWQRFEAAIKVRMRVGPAVLGAGMGYALESFTFETNDAAAKEVPSVTYHALRFAAEGRVPIGPIAIRVDVGYRLPVAAGALLARFRDGTAGGVDLSAGIAVPLPLSGIEARAGARYARYFYSFFPEPGDAYIAGGALDEYLTFEIGAAYVH